MAENVPNAEVHAICSRKVIRDVYDPARNRVAFPRLS